jgi:hypothetical protein
MIFDVPPNNFPLDQGDMLKECPLLFLHGDPRAENASGMVSYQRVLVLTQTCDLAQDKTSRIVVALVTPAEELVLSGELKEASVRGPIRMARTYGWYFLPADESAGIPELIVDFRQLHTVSREILEALCLEGHREARLRTPFREHLAKHFADTYSRIGLPEPYATQ